MPIDELDHEYDFLVNKFLREQVIPKVVLRETITSENLAIEIDRFNLRHDAQLVPELLLVSAYKQKLARTVVALAPSVKELFRQNFDLEARPQLLDSLEESLELVDKMVNSFD
jgi:hypothetical protein